MTRDESTLTDAERQILEIRKLPKLQRIAWVEGLRVFYPRWHDILEKIRRCHEMQPLAAEPPCLLLVGPTGVGKTTLLSSYLQDYPRRLTREAVRQPILKVTVLPPARVKAMASTLLYALGDPFPDRGSTALLTRRIIKLFKEHGVELLIVDEIQEFVDQDRCQVLRDVSNWLKTLIKQTGVACVLTGLSGEAERVVQSNPQLARLFGDPVELEPFVWDERQPRSVETFLSLLGQIDKILPLRVPAGLSDPATASRMYQASQGIMSYLMAFIRRATVLALENGTERLDEEVLRAAFDERMGGVRRGIANPWG